MPQCFATAVAYLAVLQMGAVAMPLSLLFGPDALAFRLQDSEAVLALCDPAACDTLLAARELGWDELDVWVVDVGEVEAKRIVAADNRTADMGLYDNEALLELLVSLPDLEGTGYTDTDLKAIEELLAGPPDLDDLLDEVGDPLVDDTHTVVRLVVDPDTAAVWLAHRKNFDNDTAALRTFMGL
jgi:acyl-CoA synthetase (AMP-forming)/AMP-acid ligase II